MSTVTKTTILQIEDFIEVYTRFMPLSGPSSQDSVVGIAQGDTVIHLPCKSEEHATEMARKVSAAIIAAVQPY